MRRPHGIFDYKIEIGGTPAGPPSGYIAWWKFEENLNDVTGNFNATLGAGTATYVTGKNGKAFSFNGSTYLNTPLTRDKWILGTHSFTVNAWVKSSQTGRFYILSSANSGGGAPAILCCEGGETKTHLSHLGSCEHYCSDGSYLHPFGHQVCRDYYSYYFSQRHVVYCFVGRVFENFLCREV